MQQHRATGLEQILVDETHDGDVVLGSGRARYDSVVVVDDLLEGADGHGRTAQIIDSGTFFDSLVFGEGRLETLLILNKLLLKQEIVLDALHLEELEATSRIGENSGYCVESARQRLVRPATASRSPSASPSTTQEHRGRPAAEIGESSGNAHFCVGSGPLFFFFPTRVGSGGSHFFCSRKHVRQPFRRGVTRTAPCSPCRASAHAHSVSATERVQQRKRSPFCLVLRPDSIQLVPTAPDRVSQRPQRAHTPTHHPRERFQRKERRRIGKQPKRLSPPSNSPLFCAAAHSMNHCCTRDATHNHFS